MSTYQDVVQYLLEIPKFSSKNEANHTKGLLERIGSPQKAFSIIHVAGTNGKGSVCAYVNSVLCEAGKKVGMFTSPHLVRINERFRIQGKEVTDEKIVEAFAILYPKLQEMQAEGLAHPTFFETMLALGMLIFKEAGIEWLLLEVGLGGRKDATNVVTPTLTAITSIGRDHMEYLGNTLTEIAGEKAGIIKEGVPIVFAAGVPETNRVICQKAEEMHAPLYMVSRKQCKNFKKKNKSIAFSVESRYYESVYVKLSTIGDYQVDNALVAFQLLELTGEKITKENYEEGFRKAKWPGRMEEVSPGVFLDGAHNEPGIRAFLDTVGEREKKGKRSLIFAVVSDKEYPDMIRIICERGDFDHIVVTQLTGVRAADGETVAEIFRAHAKDTEVEFIEDIRQAWLSILSKKEEADEVFCAGSLYFIGALKGIIEKEQDYD